MIVPPSVWLRQLFSLRRRVLLVSAFPPATALVRQDPKWQLVVSFLI